MSATLARAGATTRATALGLSLQLEDALAIPGLQADPAPATAVVASAAGETTDTASTRVRLDRDGELDRRWRAARSGARRVREQRDGERLTLSIDEAEAGYLLHAPGYARILVAGDGGEVLCEPECGGSEQWTTLVFAQALPLAATLRGLEVLHASAVAMAPGSPLAGTAALFSGPQGAGKSSLAAALVRRGARLLADDTVAIAQEDGRLLAHPGAGPLQLRPAERARKRREIAAGQGVEDTAVAEESALGKHRLATPRCDESLPFGALFLLERAGVEEPPIEQIEPIDPFALLATTFNLSVRTPERLTRHLDLAGAIAATGAVFRVRVQPGIDADRLAGVVLERLAEL
jgi:hypothetical protein